jgi:hypothetical protein
MNNVTEAVEKGARPELLPLVKRELPRLEATFKFLEQDHPEYGPLIRNLTAMYGELNSLLAVACLALQYPTKQWEWSDSRPLEEVAAVYPMVQNTDWYRRHLSMILMAAADPYALAQLPPQPCAGGQSAHWPPIAARGNGSRIKLSNRNHEKNCFREGFLLDRPPHQPVLVRVPCA